MAPERVLERSPSMVAMFARAGAAMVPGASALPFVAGGGGEIPSLTLALDDVSVDRSRLAAYDRVCGFGVGEVLPATYPHMLAFPLHLALMTDGSFPFPAIGLVHIANMIRQHTALPYRHAKLSAAATASGHGFAFASARPSAAQSIVRTNHHRHAAINAIAATRTMRRVRMVIARRA